MLVYKKIHRSPWRYWLMFTVSVIVLLVIYLLVSPFPSKPHFPIPKGVVLTKYEPFEPLADTEFAGGHHTRDKIPKIIHWINPTDKVKRMHEDNLKSFLKFNPDWTFYMWTYTSTRRLIQDSFPEMLQLWDDHSEYKHIQHRRLDLARYVVLYLYGGVAVNLEARNYRSLEPVISTYSCIIPPNPYEEAIITGVPYTVTNRVMMCRKKHPFLKLIVENLHRYQHMSTAYDAVGDGFLMTHYQLYNNLQRERDDKNIFVQQSRKDPKDTTPFFFQGAVPRSDPDVVYVPNSAYFTGTSNPDHHSIYTQQCSKFFEVPVLHQRACVHLYRYGLIREPGKYAYIDLHNVPTVHLGFLNIDIKTVIPGISFYGVK